MRVSVGRATELAVGALRGIGYPAQDAATIADHLIDCELRGLGYSGLARILSIAERLGDAGPTAEPIRVLRDNPVSARLDGADNVGYLVALRATETAITKAQTTGLAAVGADNTWYTGMLSYYAELITARGLVAMIASNATPWVAPFGGSQARFGTNPFCFGFPTGRVAADLGHRHVRNHPRTSSFGAAHRRHRCPTGWPTTSTARRPSIPPPRWPGPSSRGAGTRAAASGSACSCWVRWSARRCCPES